MVEYTEEEKAKYQERLRLRAEYKAKEEAEAKAKADAEKHDMTIRRAAAQQPAKKGVLEKVADKAENVRGKYNYQKAQLGRIKNAIAPAKPQAKASQQRKPSVSRQRQRVQRRAYTYRPAPAARPSYDPLQNHIMGPPSGKSSANRMNEMIGVGGGKNNGMDFMNTMIHGSKNGKKKGGNDFWREMIGG